MCRNPWAVFDILASLADAFLVLQLTFLPNEDVCWNDGKIAWEANKTSVREAIDTLNIPDPLQLSIPSVIRYSFETTGLSLEKGDGGGGGGGLC